LVSHFDLGDNLAGSHSLLGVVVTSVRYRRFSSVDALAIPWNLKYALEFSFGHFPASAYVYGDWVELADVHSSEFRLRRPELTVCCRYRTG